MCILAQISAVRRKVKSPSHSVLGASAGTLFLFHLPLCRRKGTACVDATLYWLLLLCRFAWPLWTLRTLTGRYRRYEPARGGSRIGLIHPLPCEPISGQSHTGLAFYWRPQDAAPAGSVAFQKPRLSSFFFSFLFFRKSKFLHKSQASLMVPGRSLTLMSDWITLCNAKQTNKEKKTKKLTGVRYWLQCNGDLNWPLGSWCIWKHNAASCILASSFHPSARDKLQYHTLDSFFSLPRKVNDRKALIGRVHGVCTLCTSTWSSHRVYTNETVPGEGDWLEIAVARVPTEGRIYNRAPRDLLEKGV